MHGSEVIFDVILGLLDLAGGIWANFPRSAPHAQSRPDDNWKVPSAEEISHACRRSEPGPDDVAPTNADSRPWHWPE